MMDFNGNNRGYAFVTFSNKQEARAAMKQLNNYEIRSGFHSCFIFICIRKYKYKAFKLFLKITGKELLKRRKCHRQN